MPLLITKGPAAGKKPTRPKPESHELAEMWRLAASLERLPAETKVTLGATILDELTRPGAPTSNAWCLGRLGARVPLYGPANTTVPAPTAEAWTRRLLHVEPVGPRDEADLALALSFLARVSCDRSRDLDPDLRAEVLSHLETLHADEPTRAVVREYHDLAASQQARALGDALPIGLRLAVADGV